MSAVVGTTLPAFAATICRADDPESRQAMQADLLHLYNTRATQYGFFPLATDNSAESSQGPLLSLAGIRLTEALDCPDDAALLSLAIESVAGGLSRMREELPLQDTIRHVMTRIQ